MLQPPHGPTHLGPLSAPGLQQWMPQYRTLAGWHPARCTWSHPGTMSSGGWQTGEFLPECLSPTAPAYSCAPHWCLCARPATCSMPVGSKYPSWTGVGCGGCLCTPWAKRCSAQPTEDHQARAVSSHQGCRCGCWWVGLPALQGFHCMPVADCPGRAGLSWYQALPQQHCSLLQVNGFVEQGWSKRRMKSAQPMPGPHRSATVAGPAQEHCSLPQAK